MLAKHGSGTFHLPQQRPELGLDWSNYQPLQLMHQELNSTLYLGVDGAQNQTTDFYICIAKWHRSPPIRSEISRPDGCSNPWTEFITSQWGPHDISAHRFKIRSHTWENQTEIDIGQSCNHTMLVSYCIYDDLWSDIYVWDHNRNQEFLAQPHTRPHTSQSASCIRPSDISTCPAIAREHMSGDRYAFCLAHPHLFFVRASWHFVVNPIDHSRSSFVRGS